MLYLSFVTMGYLLLALLLCSVYNLDALQTSSHCTEPADVVFILNSSTSISRKDFYKQRNFVTEVIDEFNIGPNADQTRVGVLTFGHEVWHKFDLKDHLDSTSLKDAVRIIEHGEGRRTNTGDAIIFAVTKMFTPEAGSRKDVTHIAIVITDGRSQDTLTTKLAALRAHESEISIFAIGVGSQIVTEELKSIASDPDDEFMFNVMDFTALSFISEKLAKKTCAVTNAPSTPTNISKDINKECKGKPADVFFLIDASGSIRTKDFSKELDFVKKVVDEFDISQSTTRVGILVFSSDASITLELNNNLSKEDLIKKIQGVKHTGGGTNTADALRKVRQHGYAAGIARPNVAQIVVLLTDGLSADEDLTKREAKLTHMAGIKVFSIGIGAGVDIIEMQDVASDPDDDYVFQVDDFGSLDTIKNELAVKTCAEPTKEECKGKSADVFFLIDASGSINMKYFSKELDFVEKVVDEFDISQSTTRVGILVFSADASITLGLNNNLSKKDLIKNIQGVKYTGGGTNTADALLKVRQHGYASDIARPNVAQIVVLLSDGGSDNNELTKREAKLTHMAGIKVFSIGIGSGVDSIEMRDVASDPDDDYVFQVDDFASLDSIIKQIAVRTCDGVKTNEIEVCEILSNTDVMFIYDTASLGDYKSRVISELLIVVVSYLDIKSGLLQVGRVTDNCPSGENFPLSNKVSPDDFSNIRFSTYSHLIKKVRKSGFSVDNNGRVDSVKVAVLFIDSEMTDPNALQEATAMMQQTAEVFIVTIGKSPKVDEFVGQFSERNVIQVNSYDDLSTASTQILHKMCFFLENNGKTDYTIDYVIPV